MPRMEFFSDQGAHAYVPVAFPYISEDWVVYLDGLIHPSRLFYIYQNREDGRYCLCPHDPTTDHIGPIQHIFSSLQEAKQLAERIIGPNWTTPKPMKASSISPHDKPKKKKPKQSVSKQPKPILQCLGPECERTSDNFRFIKGMCGGHYGQHKAGKELTVLKERKKENG